jgi:hypothetical protein
MDRNDELCRTCLYILSLRSTSRKGTPNKFLLQVDWIPDSETSMLLASLLGNVFKPGLFEKWKKLENTGYLGFWMEGARNTKWEFGGTQGENIKQATYSTPLVFFPLSISLC